MGENKIGKLEAKFPNPAIEEATLQLKKIETKARWHQKKRIIYSQH